MAMDYHLANRSRRFTQISPFATANIRSCVPGPVSKPRWNVLRQRDAGFALEADWQATSANSA